MSKSAMHNAPFASARRSSQQIRQELGTDPVSLANIRDPKIFEAEREKIFRKTWLKITEAWELPNIGDYIVQDFPVLGTSIIVVRGKDHRLRAFHNVCTHRGNKVVPVERFETRGNARANALTCRFHGWVFGTDGALRSVPMSDAFGQLDVACLGLKKIRCETWEGFVFVNLDDEGTESLEVYLGDFGKLFAGYPYGDSTTSYRYSTILNCNWKVAYYAFSEGYHVPTIHAGSLPGFRGVEHSDFKLMGPHASSTIYGAGMEVADSTKIFGSVLQGSETHGPKPDQLPFGINPSRRSDFQFELPNVFPNLILHLSGGCGYPGLSFFTHQFWPLNHGRTLWQGTNYFRPPQTEAERLAQRHINALHRNAWLEDTATMEDTFAGIMSGVIDDMQLMDQEFLIRHAAQTLDRYLAA